MDDEQPITTLLDVFLSRDFHNMLQMRIAQNEKKPESLETFLEGSFFAPSQLLLTWRLDSCAEVHCIPSKLQARVELVLSLWNRWPSKLFLTECSSRRRP